MKACWWTLLIMLVVRPAWAQAPTASPSSTGIPVLEAGEGTGRGSMSDDDGRLLRGFLTGDKGFTNFIGYISNPALAIDPRSLTQLIPIYDYISIRPIKPLPAGEINIVGPALSVAVTERLNIGITSGGPVITSFPNRHQGWLDIGGYAQYTLIRDVPDQLLATVGLGWTAPSGSSSLFQGSPPAYLAPYFTVGKEFGDFHILTTNGFKFPAGSGTVTTDTFYGTVHLDRRCFGWLYPLVEFNWSANTRRVNLDLPFRPGIFGLDNFSADGGIVTVAPGVNAVLIPDKLELGAVYQTPIASENHIHFNSFLVKMILRY